MEREARVVKNAGSHYLLSELPVWEPFPAVLRGKTRLGMGTTTNPVAVGDRVIYEPGDGEAAIIQKVLPRDNYIIRKSTNLSRQSHIIAANVDQAVIAVSLFFPEIKLPFLDRILVTCEVYKVPVVIALNKVDLYRDDAPEAVRNFLGIYRGAGYRVIETSCKTGEGIDELREACRGRISLFSGESGAGKSSLIKALDPSLDPKIGKISLSHLQGKHTTSLYEMYPFGEPEGGISPRAGLSEAPPIGDGSLPLKPRAAIASGEAPPSGFVIDSPGLRGFGLVDLEREEIALYFPEMLRASEGCRFTPCTHTHEPGCAVKAAVERGDISPERYNSYLGMLEEDSKFRQ